MQLVDALRSRKPALAVRTRYDRQGANESADEERHREVSRERKAEVPACR